MTRPRERARKVALAACALTVLATGALAASPPVISTVAGGGIGDGGPADKAALAYPSGVALVGDFLFVADELNDRVVKINRKTNEIQTVAGVGLRGFSGDGGSALQARLNNPTGVARDSVGNIFVADRNNFRVRRVDAVTGVISTVAGGGDSDELPRPGTAAQLNYPYSLAFDPASNRLLIANSGSNRVLKLSLATGVLDVFAGTGEKGFSGDGGQAAAAKLKDPQGVALDLATPGSVLIADSGNNRVRRVDKDGVISTVAGDGTAGDTLSGPALSAHLQYPAGVASAGAGEGFYVMDTGNRRIKKVDSGGMISLVAGVGTTAFSGDGGPADKAAISLAISAAVDPSSGALAFGDPDNKRVRQIDGASGIISTIAGNGEGHFAGDGLAATAAAFSQPNGVALDADSLVVVDSANARVRRVNAKTGVVETIAGSGGYGYGGDGGPATAALLRQPSGVALDSRGRVFFSDQLNHRVRRIDTNGIITTVAGDGTAGFYGDGGSATSAALNNPIGLAIDEESDRVFIADSYNARVRVLDQRTGVISTYAGSGADGYAGDGGPATAASLSGPTGLALDGRGGLVIADAFNDKVRYVDKKTGIISTLASSATFRYPTGVAVDRAGARVYVAAANGERVFVIDTATDTAQAWAGTGKAGFSGDGGPALDAQIYYPYALALDETGTKLWFSDVGNDRVRLVDAGPPLLQCKEVTAALARSKGGGGCDAAQVKSSDLWAPTPEAGGAAIVISAPPQGASSYGPGEHLVPVVPSSPPGALPCAATVRVLPCKPACARSGGGGAHGNKNNNKNNNNLPTVAAAEGSCASDAWPPGLLDPSTVSRDPQAAAAVAVSSAPVPPFRVGGARSAALTLTYPGGISVTSPKCPFKVVDKEKPALEATPACVQPQGGGGSYAPHTSVCFSASQLASGSDNCGGGGGGALKYAVSSCRVVASGSGGAVSCAAKHGGRVCVKLGGGGKSGGGGDSSSVAVVVRASDATGNTASVASSIELFYGPQDGCQKA